MSHETDKTLLQEDFGIKSNTKIKVLVGLIALSVILFISSLFIAYLWDDVFATEKPLDHYDQDVNAPCGNNCR